LSIRSALHGASCCCSSICFAGCSAVGPLTGDFRGETFGPIARTIEVLSEFVGSLVFLAILGMIGAKAGRAGILKATIRVTFWGALAMALTTGIGALFGTVA
jgi:hypothetical protein